MNSCWIEISRSALRQNFQSLQNFAGTDKTLICVIKADAYGCGALETARELATTGAPYFAVTRLEEALPLRDAGIQTPILLLSPVAGDESELLQHDLTATVTCLEDAQRLAAASEKWGLPARAHLKLDTGMGRFGLTIEELNTAIATKSWPENIDYEGIFTHFPDAGASDKTATEEQARTFMRGVNALSTWREPKYVHCANSSFLVRYPFQGNAARPGTLLYGQFPTPVAAADGKEAGLKLIDVFQAKARIVSLRKVKAGTPIGYGSEWKAPRDSVIAILACGYADGLTLEPRARTETPLSALRSGFERAARLFKNPHTGRVVTVRGNKVPLVGRIAMQTCAVDVTDVKDVQLSDEVTLPMRRVTAGGHLPRVYVE